jgi:hypothetical protein
VAAFVACVASLAAGYMVWYASSEGHLRYLMTGVVGYVVLAGWSIASLFTQRRALLGQALSDLAVAE